MSKIIRKTQLIFGSTALTDQIAQFGSLAAGSAAYSTDPNVIQALSNYKTGWFAAVIGGNSPAIEDMNALHYLYAYQLAYVMQSGVPEYDSLTVYYIGSIVNDGLGNLYISLTDNNVGNPLTSAGNWRAQNQTVGDVPIGAVLPTFSNLTGAYVCSATTVADFKGYVLCQGQTLADATSPMNGQVIPNLTSGVFISGSTSAGITGGAASVTLYETNMAPHVHSISGGPWTVAAESHTHNMDHFHQWNYLTISNNYSLINGSTTQGPFNSSTGGNCVQWETGSTVQAGSTSGVVWSTGSGGSGTSWYTSYPMGNGTNPNYPHMAVTGDESGDTTITLPSATGSEGGGTAFSILPPYITAVYIMRVK